jgi:hypothetical protein
MKCRLCLQKKKLCKSHIIPEFFYKTLYSEKEHKFIQLSGTKKVIKWQKGFKEKLLCEDCESKLNKWETYAANILFNDFVGNIKRMNDAIVIDGVDYSQFKLFQMSIIWRAGVTSLQQFSNVNLGPHEEKLRIMVLEDNPGEDYEYGCLIICTPSYSDITKQMLMAPQPSKFDGHHCYVFFMAGLSWVFFVSSHTSALPYREKLFLNSDGTLPLIVDDKASKLFLEKTFSEWKKSGKLDEAIKKNNV